MTTTVGDKLEDHPAAPAAELRRIGVLSPFDEARATITQWEKDCPAARRISLIMQDGGDFAYSITGKLTTTEAVGIFFRAAHLAAE